MLNRIPNHVVDLFSRVLKLIAKNPRAANYTLHDNGNILRIIFDKNKKLLPSGLTSNAKFLTRHKNKEHGGESVIYLFFSKRLLKNSVRHQGILMHELMHYNDFDVVSFFDKKYLDKIWKKLSKLYFSGNIEKYKIAAKEGAHEERARRVQELYKKEKRGL